ncbi:hypothetical protein C8R46DRAFT_1286272 [Mycena filopes]|nr:hypothetical protein C8R46DRAFT_1286272 [Mycena filopes]
MPRRVRWSLANIFHSPPPPALASPSLSSAASSDGSPIPPLSYAGLPGPTPFAPRAQHPQYAPRRTPARAHNLIAFSHHHHHPLLHYDVALPPSSVSISTRYRYRGVPPAAFLEPATYPPALAITLTTPHLPWAIRVVAAANGRYVTVTDVLNAVYLALRATATHTEFLTLGTPKLMHLVAEAAAYRRRCRCERERVLLRGRGRGRGRRGLFMDLEEKQMGIRRVDFLMGYTRFRGIEPGRSFGVWQLHIS